MNYFLAFQYGIRFLIVFFSFRDTVFHAVPAIFAYKVFVLDLIEIDIFRKSLVVVISQVLEGQLA